MDVSNTDSGKQTKKLFRSANDRMVAGVCGGIGSYIGIDPTVIRILWILLTLITGVVPGIFAYLIAAIIIPNESEAKVIKLE